MQPLMIQYSSIYIDLKVTTNDLEGDVDRGAAKSDNTVEVVVVAANLLVGADEKTTLIPRDGQAVVTISVPRWGAAETNDVDASASHWARVGPADQRCAALSERPTYGVWSNQPVTTNSRPSRPEHIHLGRGERQSNGFCQTLSICTAGGAQFLYPKYAIPKLFMFS